MKPANLLFGDDRRLRIADFGLARALAEAAWTEPEGVVLGTARYVSPEQAAGGALDGRSDVYSLALVLVECVTGRVPHAGDTAVASLQARIGRSIEAPPELGPLGPIVEAAGRADPAERWSAAQLGRALMAVAGDLPSPEPLTLAPALPDPAAPFDAEPSTVVAPLPGGPCRHGARRQRRVRAPTPPAGSGTCRPHLRRPRRLRHPSAAAARAAAPRADGRVGRVAQRARGSRPVPRERGRPARTRPPPPRPGPPALRSPSPVEAPARRRHRGGRWVVAALLVAALVTLGVLAASVLRGQGTPELFPVADFRGRQIDEVQASLPEGSDWQVDRVDGRRDDTRPGEVLDQDPAAGGQLEEGGVLHLTVSQGDELRAVPDLVGLPADEAAKQLAASGLVLAQPSREQWSETAPAGQVIDVVEKGQQLPKAAHVTLVVSKGPEPRTVPAVSGTPEAASRRAERPGPDRGDRGGLLRDGPLGPADRDRPAGRHPAAPRAPRSASSSRWAGGRCRCPTWSACRRPTPPTPSRRRAWWSAPTVRPTSR